MKAGSLSHLSARFPVLSCDIFDTAIRRTLARPEDVFLAVGARLQGAISCTPEAFAVHRQTAERAAREIAASQGHDEVRLAEIYAWLQATGIVEHAECAARIEFEVECAVCTTIEPVRSAVLAHRCAVFASDTQLPAAWLQELLASCGYGAGCRVFSSADLRLSKHTGRLFPAMLSALGKPAADVLHIGDNPISDVERPQKYGIAAHLIPRQRAPAAAAIGCHPITRLAISHANTRPLPPPGPAQVGVLLARLATPLLIGFALFILAQARTRGVTRLYFLARDGHLPMAIVHRLLEASGETARFSLHYLEVSRAAMANTEAARAYLQTSGFLAPGRRLVIDLGWRGSIQAALRAIAGPTAEIFGCYVALWSNALRPDIGPANAAGYLSSFGDPILTDGQLREFYVILELIFSAPHGTVLGYDEHDHDPIRAIEVAPAGTVRRAAFAALEEACLQTVEALGSMLAGSWPAGMDGASALAPLSGALSHPTHSLVTAINTVPFIHGADGTQLLPAVNPLPLHEAVLAPSRSLRRLRNAPWRAGAIRAALPAFLPFIDYATLAHHLRRVGIVA